MELGRRGRKRQLELEDEYWKLVLAGVGTVEACRQVGIGRKTGYRWRAERGGIPPARVAEESRSSRYLSLLERQRIATLHERGLGVREIARRLDRAPSTISRELKRNMCPHDQGIYDADLAHARARAKARRERAGKLVGDDALRALVQQKLELDWSPQQIVAWLRVEHPGKPGWHVCHETIYQALYYGGKGGLSRTPTKRLRTGRPLRKRRRRINQRQIRFIAPAAPIDARPPVIELRHRIGDWEGDLIVGRMSQSATGTLVDRTSRFVRLVHLPAGHAAEAFVDAVAPVLATLPESARLSLTWDQGSEMARHDLLAPHFSDGVYFARPASPWLRGTNENTNGLLRQYFPKGIDLRRFTVADLARVEHLLNHRPRRILGWRTPAAVFTERLQS
ncbi:IS30 family transposase [Actinomadura verrucosospora]